jgi:hypothetical protein
MDDQNSQNIDPDPELKPTKGYGKRPIWQWVVIYLIVAVVVYGLIYLVFFNGNSGVFHY